MLSNQRMFCNNCCQAFPVQQKEKEKEKEKKISI
jgi:hypothetical protein